METDNPSLFKGSYFADDSGKKFSVEKVYDFVQSNKIKYIKKSFPISKIKDQLEWWYELYRIDNPQHKARMLAADTSYPLLVIRENGRLSVADGLNRLYKAINIEHKSNIDIYLVDKEDILHFAEHTD